MVHVISPLRPPVAPARVHATPLHSRTGATASTGSNTGSPPTHFSSLLSGSSISAAGPDPTSTPTAESVFGPNPWVANPTGTGPGGPYPLNPYYFATPQTAAIVAQMVGGTVVQANSFTPNGGGFRQPQANLMVQLPDGRMINPGLVASFYTHGYSQSYVDMMVACEVKNA
jgi:hypothetical protein